MLCSSSIPTRKVFNGLKRNWMKNASFSPLLLMLCLQASLLPGEAHALHSFSPLTFAAEYKLVFTGKLVNERGETLSGCSITEKGTSNTVQSK